MTKGWHDRAQRFHSCPLKPGKGRYVDRGVAEAAARKRETPERPLFTYLCRACKGWHLTHKEQR